MGAVTVIASYVTIGLKFDDWILSQRRELAVTMLTTMPALVGSCGGCLDLLPADGVRCRQDVAEE